jgi:carboxymethylenebutenolidase
MAAGSMITLTASDAHVLDAYKAVPEGTPKGGVVVVQEIFGVSGHIKRVTDGFAAAGYLAIAPAMFDRLQKNMIFDYTDMASGRDAVSKLSQENTVADLSAAVTAAKAAGGVAVVGYCWGGAQAYLAACKVRNVAGAINYYGTRTLTLCESMTPAIPVLYHFGAQDKTIPPEGIAKVKAAHPAGIYHIYDADHGFNCDERSHYNPAAAKQALDRTLKFMNDVCK